MLLLSNEHLHLLDRIVRKLGGTVVLEKKGGAWKTVRLANRWLT